MEKSFNDPYDNPELAKGYEDRYLKHPSQISDIKHEIDIIKKVVSICNYSSWLDIACGTAYHLRKTEGDIQRYGLDRSSTMLNQNKKDTKYKITYYEKDFLKWRNTKKFDLVTNFWFGYAHQPTLKNVLSFLDKLVEKTSVNGSVLISLHNQWKIFDTYQNVTDEPMGGKFLFNAMHWSYKEPLTGDLYECIVPHKNLIQERLSKHFDHFSFLDYPVYAGKELLLLQGKKNGT
tara:strand:+ start:37 stop:735 length:699 start_codon:yes stop_codon:yes gene_type:complete